METYVQSLKYEVDHTTNQACFYVDQIPEKKMAERAEGSGDTTVQRFLWQSQKWHLTMYDERLLPIVTPHALAAKRRIVRRLKRSDEGQRYVVSEVLYTHNNSGNADRGPHKLREFTWTPKDIGIGESYILVTFDDDEQDLSRRLISESELTKSFTSSYRASVSTAPYDDFEMTYDEDNEELFMEKSLRQPLGGLARLSYITEKLLHINETTATSDDVETHETKPINIKLHYQDPEIWIGPYDGNYGMNMSHFQISERFGDSIESSLLQMTKRGRTGGYLSDFSFSFSDVRRLKRFRKTDGMAKKTYTDLPSDVIVIDAVKPTSPVAIPRESDEEEFEDLSFEFANLTEKNKPKETTNNTQPSNKEVAVVVQPPKTLLSKKDEKLYKKATETGNEVQNRPEARAHPPEITANDSNDTEITQQVSPAPIVVPNITVEDVSNEKPQTTKHGDKLSFSDDDIEEFNIPTDSDDRNENKYDTLQQLNETVGLSSSSDTSEDESEEDNKQTGGISEVPAEPTVLEASSSSSSESEREDEDQSSHINDAVDEEHQTEVLQPPFVISTNDLEDDVSTQRTSSEKATMSASNDLDNGDEIMNNDYERPALPTTSDNEVQDREVIDNNDDDEEEQEQEQEQKEVADRINDTFNDDQTYFQIPVEQDSSNNEGDEATTENTNQVNLADDEQQTSSASDSSDNEDDDMATTTTTGNKEEQPFLETEDSTTVTNDNNGEYLKDDQQTSYESDSTDNEKDKLSPAVLQLDTMETIADNHEDISTPKVS